MSVISFKDVKLSFDGQKVLDIASLEINKGVKLAVTGESGSGKTTLLNIMCALERIDEGEICWDNLSLGNLNEFQKDAFRGERVGLIMQDFHLYEGLSALDNVLLPSKFRYFKIPDFLESRAIFLLSSLNLKNYSQNVDTLSRGEKQRVAIARAFLNNPDVIIADEPTASLDKRNGEEAARLLLGLSADRTLICVTHDLALADKLDFRLELKKGERIEASFK